MIGIDISGTFTEAVLNDTWGHTAPHKNTSYKGKVRFTFTDHNQYGWPPVIITYDFKNLNGGPYLHDALFNYSADNWKEEDYEIGAIYDVEMTFRNYRFYQKKPKKVLDIPN